MGVSENPDDFADAAKKNPYRWIVLFGVWLSYYCFGLTTISLAPLVGAVGADLGLNHARMGTVMGAWQLVYIGSAIPCGILLDRLGPRRAILFAVLIIAASAALRATAEGHLSLFLAVAVFGLGGPIVSIGAPKLISLWFDAKGRGLAMGIYMTGPTLGAMTALSLTNSVLMPYFDGNWRTTLLCYAAFIVLAAAVWLMVTAHPACRALEKDLAAAPKESQLETFKALMGIPAVRIVLVMSVGIFFFNHGLGNWLPEILRGHGMDAATAGFWASVPALVGVCASLTIPRLATTSQRQMTILFGLFIAAGAASLLLHNVGGTLLTIGLVMQGIARGGMMTLAILVLLDIPQVGARRAGLAGGIFFSAAEVGGVLGPVTIGVLSETSGSFTSTLSTLTGICAGLIVLLFALQRAKTRPSTATTP